MVSYGAQYLLLRVKPKRSKLSAAPKRKGLKFKQSYRPNAWPLAKVRLDSLNSRRPRCCRRGGSFKLAQYVTMSQHSVGGPRRERSAESKPEAMAAIEVQHQHQNQAQQQREKPSLSTVPSCSSLNFPNCNHLETSAAGPLTVTSKVTQAATTTTKTDLTKQVERLNREHEPVGEKIGFNGAETRMKFASPKQTTSTSFISLLTGANFLPNFKINLASPNHKRKPEHKFGPLELIITLYALVWLVLQIYTHSTGEGALKTGPGFILFASAATTADQHANGSPLPPPLVPPEPSEEAWLPVADVASYESAQERNKFDKMLTDELEVVGEAGKSPPRERPIDIIKPKHLKYDASFDHKRQSRHHHRSRRARHLGRRAERLNEPLKLEKSSETSFESQSSTRGRSRRHDGGGFFDSNSAADRPLVATKKGLIRGVTQKIVTGKFVDAFLGIPFAQPPSGKYRFRHPLPINPWPGEIDASRMSNSCYQINDTFFGAGFSGTSIWNANTPLSEDCLYLNIWTPFGVANTTTITSGPVYHRSSEQTKPASKRPVLVWIFGGGFWYGTSSLALYEGGVLASEEDIIVVSMNYRVSALGFLYFGRPDAPGNAGLFDQLMALQWINDNIDQFGGDPNRVTIFGESAGAVSVAFHLLSPLSRNLFSQAILQSGAATCPWGSMEARDLIANGLQLASLVNCPSKSSDLDAVIECLLKADPMALVSQEVGQTRSILNFPFVPVVDGSFLLESPKESLMKSNFKPAKVLLGSNYDEGNSWLIYYLPEFSQCPSNSGSNNNNENSKLEQSQGQHQRVDSQFNSQNTPSNGDLGANGDLAVASDLRDQSGEHLDSYDSASPGRQHSIPQPMQQGSQMISNSPVEAQAQHNLHPNDSKPCKPNEFLAMSREDFLRVLRDDLNPFADHAIGKDAIAFEYSNWNNPMDPVSNYDALDKIVGDYYFTCHVNEFAQSYATAGNSVYMYYFKQRSSISPWPKWMGVIHADEINFVFGEPLNPMYNYTAKEVELSRRMMRYWANFAKYGNPTKLGENSSMVEKWPEYGDKRQYFELHADYTRLGRGPRSKQCAFWSLYLPKMIESFERSQCSTSPTASRPPFIHPLELGYNQSQRIGFLPSVPTPILLGLFVIALLTIIGLLVYAKRTWKLDLNIGSSENSN